MINSVNTRYIQHLDQYLQLLGEYMRLNFRIKRGGDAVQPHGGVEELHGDPTVGPRPKVWTRGQKWKKWCR